MDKVQKVFIFYGEWENKLDTRCFLDTVSDLHRVLEFRHFDWQCPLLRVFQLLSDTYSLTVFRVCNAKLLFFLSVFSTQGDWYLHVNCFYVASDVGHDSMLYKLPMGKGTSSFPFMSVSFEAKTIGEREALLLHCCSRNILSTKRVKKKKKCVSRKSIWAQCSGWRLE